MPQTKYPPNPLPCGCGAVGIPELDHGEERERLKHIHVRFCPLHQAAGELLEAMRELVQVCSHSAGGLGANLSGRRIMAQVDKARAAIAKATGTGGNETV